MYNAPLSILQQLSFTLGKKEKYLSVEICATKYTKIKPLSPQVTNREWEDTFTKKSEQSSLENSKLKLKKKKKKKSSLFWK